MTRTAQPEAKTNQPGFVLSTGRPIDAVAAESYAVTTATP